MKEALISQILNGMKNTSVCSARRKCAFIH